MSSAYNYSALESGCLSRSRQWLLGAFLVVASQQVLADTYTYQAISDFEDITAGEVPYYIDTVAGRNVLAIDAAIVDYREKFARATTMFTGDSGTFDITITALGEIDGEGEFRFLVNGEVVGSAVNERVDVDWGEQLHVFQNIEIVSGDEISVESDARSNDLIPENDEYAFARGRWRELELVADDAATANPVTTNLAVSVASQPEQAELGDLVATVVSVANIGVNNATNPRVFVSPGAGLQFVSGDGCSIETSDGVISCTLEEVAAASVAVSGLAFIATATGNTSITVEVTADQTDTDPSDNEAVATVDIVTGDNLETLASTAASSLSAVAMPATDSETEQASDTLQSAEASGSSGGSGRPSMALFLLLLFSLLPRFGRLWRN